MRQLLSVIHEQTSVRQEVKSSEYGRVVIPALPPGLYTVEVEAAGFRKHRQTGVRVDSAARVALDISLEVGTVSESVTVSASTVPIQRETSQAWRAGTPGT